MKISRPQTPAKYLKLGIALLCISQTAFADPKGTVCTMTFNSSDEKDAFQARIPEKDFNFVELVTSEPSSADATSQEWFDKVCSDAKKNNLKCDVLLVSGHFGGGFFGHGKSLRLETLEKHSCAKSCEGILNDPKATYSFSCNTLATKAADFRKPEQYVKVLVDEGVPRERAEEIAMERYSPLGPANQERMLGVLGNTPRIYGFESTSPLGNEVKDRVDHYLTEVPNFKNYIDGLGKERNNQNRASMLSKFLATNNKTADPFQRCLRDTSVICLNGVCQKDQPLTDEFCKLNDESIPLKDRLTLLQSDLSGSRALAFIPTAQKMLKAVDPEKMSPQEKAALLAIQNNKAAKTKFMTTLGTMKYAPLSSLALFKFAEKIGWMTKQESLSARQGIVYHWFDDPSSLENRELIYMLDSSPNVSEIISGLPEDKILKLVSGLNDENTLAVSGHVLNFLKSKNKNVMDQLGALVGNESRPSARSAAITILGASEPLSPEIVEKIAGALNAPEGYLREDAVTALADHIAGNPVMLGRIENALKDRKLGVRQRAVRVLGRLPSPDQDVINKLVEMLKDPDDYVRDEAATALDQIKPQDLETVKKIQELKSAPGFGITY